MGKKRFKFRYVLLGLLAAVLAYAAGTAVSICNYARVDETCRADVAIVLGAGASDAGVSPVFRERINHGIWLYRAGYVEKLILTGGTGAGNRDSDAAIARRYAVSQGVPEEDILLEEESAITQENIENAKAVMERNSLATALLVSDPLHMKRAMLMARDAGIEAYSSPTPTTRYVSLKTKLPFLAREVFFYTGYRLYRLCPGG